MIDRGDLCADGGCNVVNFKGCAKCGAMSMPEMRDRKQEVDEDGCETITFTHVCPKCDHVVGKHEHVFEVVDDYQEYTMTCVLCGRGADTRSVMPVDPRASAIF